jgi:hypothetical protein
MNNFVFSQDPLLFQSVVPQHQIPMSENDMKRQLDATIAQYQNLQNQMQQSQPQQTQQRDYLGELDGLTKNVKPEVAEKLSVDVEYLKLNAELQNMIQEEMLRNVKWKINTNHVAVSKMDRIREIIVSANREIDDENARNMMELNDYIKNYSDLTFDEYKQLKNRK